jgi:hypothetical protein
MVQEAQPSKRKLSTILAVGALILAVVVVVIVLVLALGGRDEGEEAVAAASARLMPADTFTYFTFNPHLDQAKNFEVLDRAWGDNPTIKEGLAEMLSSMQAGGLDYKADIEPWLGDEIGFSIGANFFTAMGDAIDDTFEQIEKSLSGEPVQPSPEMAQVPQFTLAVATKDRAASDKFLDKLRGMAEESGATLEETEYKGIKVVYQEGEMAYATVDDFVVLTAGGLGPMQAIIDARDGDNLDGNQNYQDVLDKLPADQIAYGYIDVGAYMSAMLEAAGPGLAELPPELFDPEQLKAFKGAGYSIGLESNGLKVAFVASYDKDALPESMPGATVNPNKAAGRTPASAWFYLSGTGLGNVLQSVLDAVKAMPEQPPDLDEQLQMATAMLGVSLEDLVEMLSGEFAVVITPDAAGIGGDPSVPLGAAFMMEAKDQEKWEKLLTSVSALLGMGAEMEFPRQTINDVEVRTVPNPATGGIVVGWGVGKDFFALGTNQELLEAAFGAGGPKLTDDATYKKATAPLPGKNTGIFYMDVEGLLKMVVEAMDPWDRDSFEEQGRAFLDPIKAISAAVEPFDKDKGHVSGTFFILIESE